MPLDLAVCDLLQALVEAPSTRERLLAARARCDRQAHSSLGVRCFAPLAGQDARRGKSRAKSDAGVSVLRTSRGESRKVPVHAKIWLCKPVRGKGSRNREGWQPACISMGKQSQAYNSVLFGPFSVGKLMLASEQLRKGYAPSGCVPTKRSERLPKQLRRPRLAGSRFRQAAGHTF